MILIQIKSLFPLLACFLIIFDITANDQLTLEKAPKGWPNQVKTVHYLTTIDHSHQPMLIYPAKGQEKRPLLIGLHTWSGSYSQAGGQTLLAKWAINYNWNFIHPHFRGPNRTPDACGSDKVVQDILDAVAFMKKNYNIDEDRIYLIGGSGGGYTALMMAGKVPDMWAGVSAWVPISDILTWWRQKKQQGSKYAADIEKVIGGQPSSNIKYEKECLKRSPITYLINARNTNIDINAGVKDGRNGSVPFTHSLYAFNAIVPPEEQLSYEFINSFYENLTPPEGTPQPKPDPVYGSKNIIFRKIFNNTRVTIFNGKHEFIPRPGLNWLSQQMKGKPALWQLPQIDQLNIWNNDTESGK